MFIQLARTKSSANDHRSQLQHYVFNLIKRSDKMNKNSFWFLPHIHTINGVNIKIIYLQIWILHCQINTISRILIWKYTWDTSEDKRLINETYHFMHIKNRYFDLIECSNVLSVDIDVSSCCQTMLFLKIVFSNILEQFCIEVFILLAAVTQNNCCHHRSTNNHLYCNEKQLTDARSKRM